jgi:hypothetical protein
MADGPNLELRELQLEFAEILTAMSYKTEFEICQQ